MANKSAALTSLWHGLQGTWRLNRTLHSMNAAEPSGKCLGTATFTSRQAGIFVDGEGKLQIASKEMLYAEQGEFEMSSNVESSVQMPKFSFSRKYVWRLRDEDGSRSEISIWFVKPGTEQIDYLFHKFNVQHVSNSGNGGKDWTTVECSGGHLCVEDFYSSTYTFQLANEGLANSMSHSLESWTMHHEVRGPKKEQVIETAFTRESSRS